MAAKQKKVLLMERLLGEGFFDNEKEAAAYLMAGDVLVDGQKAKGGMKVSPDAQIEVKGKDMPFVGKGGFKMTGALEDFHLDVTDRVCIDAGACTGGFTDCLVQRGAKLVYAVDVGFGQLMGKLRQDKRVVNLEKTNISDEKLLTLDPRPTLGTVDVSYLSLRKAVPYFAAILHGQGDLVCLVKPLFEIDDPEARRTGIIREEQYAPLLSDLIDDLNAMENTRCMALSHSHVTGNAGTREFFLHVNLGSGEEAPDIKHQIPGAVERAGALEQYKK